MHLLEFGGVFVLTVCFGKTVIRRGEKPTGLSPISPIRIVRETNNITSSQLGSILTCQACIAFKETFLIRSLGVSHGNTAFERFKTKRGAATIRGAHINVAL